MRFEVCVCVLRSRCARSLSVVLLAAVVMACSRSSGDGTFAPVQASKISSKSLAMSGIEGSGEARSAPPIRANAAAHLMIGVPAAATGYRIGPQDVLDFAVFKVAELQRTLVVAENGTVNIPLVGETKVAGRTAAEVERDVAQRLSRTHLQDPQVSLIVREYNSQRITIEGAVKRPGIYPLRSQTTLLQAVAMAEGFTETGDTTVIVFRDQGQQKLAAKFDVSDIRTGVSGDLPLRAGDMIVAPTSAAKEAFAAVLKAMPLATFAALVL